MTEEGIRKAGCFIYGKNAHGERAFVMPYSEGRFGERDKYYVMPTGSVDKEDQDVLAGAMRETCEETGVDVAKLLGEDAVAKLRRGEDVINLASPGYPGVTILRAQAKPYIFNPKERIGFDKTMAIYGIEIQGIETLQSALKNPQNYPDIGFRNPQVKKSTADRIRASERPYPTFDQLLEWLRQGVPAAADWNKGLTMPPPLFVKKAGERSVLEELESIFADHGKVTTPEQLQQLADRVPPKDYEPLLNQFKAIKQHLKDLKVTTGDHDRIKLDIRNSPMTYFQEGANIITARAYIKTCLDLMDRNRDYERSHGGTGRGGCKEGYGIRLNRSNFAGILPFVEPRDIFLAIKEHNEDRAKRMQDETKTWREKYLQERISAPAVARG